jgi:hypothetical protein
VDCHVNGYGTNPTNQTDLAEGYRQTAADREHEAEAEEWTEALVGDARKMIEKNSSESF